MRKFLTILVLALLINNSYAKNLKFKKVEIKENLSNIFSDIYFKNDSLEKIIEKIAWKFNNTINDPDKNYFWTVDIDSNIIFQNKKYVSIGVYSYINVNSSYPDVNFSYSTFHKKSGLLIRPEDYFSNLNELEKLLGKKFREKRNVFDNKDLKEHGFNISEKLKVPKNFCLTEKGAIFHYNPYDIGAHILGQTKIELKHLIKKKLDDNKIKIFLHSIENTYGWETNSTQISYDFLPDGRLHIQGNDVEATMWEGKWFLMDGKLHLKSKTINFYKILEVDIISNSLILDNKVYSRIK